MTVTTTNTTNQYRGNGSTNVFNVTFQFWDDADIEVYIRTRETGAEVQKTLSTHYTISGGDGSNGFITFVPATVPAATDLTDDFEIHIRRNTVTTQQFDFTPSTVFPSADTERALDRAAMRDQEDRADFLDRAIRNPVTDKDPSTGAPDMTLPSSALRASKYLYFDTDGQPTAAALTVGTATVTDAGAALIDDNTVADQRTTLSVPENAGDVPKLQAGLVAARPVAGTFGKGIWVTTDVGSEAVYYSDNSSWVEVAAEMGVQPSYAKASIPAAAAARLGTVYYDTDNNVLVRDNGSALVEVDAAWGRGYIAGLAMRRDPFDGQVRVFDGECRAGTSGTALSVQNLKLPTSMNKILDHGTGWSAGASGVARPTGCSWTVNTSYAVYLIGKPDGTVDWGIDEQSTALDYTDTPTNLMGTSAGQAGHASFGFTTYRRIGWVTAESVGPQNVKAFQSLGNFFEYDGPQPSGLYVAGADFTNHNVNRTITCCHPNTIVQARIAANNLAAENAVHVNGRFMGTAAHGPQDWTDIAGGSEDPGWTLYAGESTMAPITFMVGAAAPRLYIHVEKVTAGGSDDDDVDFEVIIDGWWDYRDPHATAAIASGSTIA